MIINFKFSNHLSFKDETNFSMVSVPSFKEHEETNTIPLNEDTSLIRTAGIFGANGSGKSNFIKSIFVMVDFVQNSFNNASKDSDRIPLNRFLLNKKSLEQPSMFEMTFMIDEVMFRYGFSITNEEIVEEYLYRTLERETNLFKREYQKIRINKSSFSEGKQLESKTRSNVLFLSVVNQFNGEISKMVFEWFRSINCISGLDDSGYRKFTTEQFRSNPEFKKWADQFVSFLEIEQVTTQEIEVNVQSPVPADDTDLMDAIEQLNRKKGNKFEEVLTWHRQYDENGFLVGTIPFVMRHQESQGTQKLIYLLGPYYDSIKNGRILVVDEFDSRLHTLLSSTLIKYFNLTKNSKSQMIFALHDTNLLDGDLFRRDQIYFVEKDQFGASDIYSLSDYKSARVRKSENLEKKYLEGKYGAIPTFEEFEDITEPANA